MTETTLFSANRLSLTLKRDRAAVTKALADVPPDGYERNQPRWLVSTAVRALERRAYRQRPTNSNLYRDKFDFGRPTRLDSLRNDYDKGLDAILAAKNREEKMALALALAPVIGDYGRVFTEVGRAINAAGGDDFALGCRRDLIFSEMMHEVENASEWPPYGYKSGNDPRCWWFCALRKMHSADNDTDTDYERYDEYGNYIGGDGLDDDEGPSQDRKKPSP